MELLTIIFLMLVTIGISNIVNHYLPSIPVPLIQIGLGIILAILPLGIHIPMEPELFFVLFIAPLLFNDGKKFPRTELWRLKQPILMLALGLVFLTVLVIGYLIHWLIPSIPLPAAFALAGILSPTDVVAVGAIASRIHIPKREMHILEGEGLMNDASGLVAFKFAVAATVTGVFSLSDAVGSFLAISLGGFIGGAILAYIIIRLRFFIRRLGMEDVTFHMLIQILTPFVIFMIIEHFHFSGILSVVAAGIVHAIERDRDESPNLDLRVVSTSTWTVILYILNGLVFVLLGLQIPDVAHEIFADPAFNNGVVITYIAIITAAIFLLRFLWLCLTSWFAWKSKKDESPKPTLRSLGITTFSGVRGAVTLAGVFSIPYVLDSGALFPQRSLIIFIAAGVILFTLLAASILLPFLARSDEMGSVKGNEESKEDLEKMALIQTQKAAIQATRMVMNEDNREAALDLISSYKRTLNQLEFEHDGPDSPDLKKLEAEIRVKALETESQYINKMLEEKRVDPKIAYLAQETIRRTEIAVTNRMLYRTLVIMTLIKRILLQIKHIFAPNRKELQKLRASKYNALIKLRITTAIQAIKMLKNELTPENKAISYEVIGEYNKIITKYKLAKRLKDPEDFAKLERDLRQKAFQAERDEIQNLYEKGEITRDITQKIRQQINIREAYSMEDK